MERLFSPWRSAYIHGFKTEAEVTGCVFCEALENQQADEERMTVYRSSEAFVLMNRYPYNSGHLLIIPNRHTSDFLSLTPGELLCCMTLLQASERALTEVSKPHGFNIGMNLGRAGGAGIEDHLHWHIVPRWNGDTNFLPIIADVKLVSEDMQTQWKKLHEVFPAIVQESKVQGGSR